MINPFSRTVRIIGEDNLEKLKSKKVAIFGVGGVGSFVAEGLARSGVENLILIDMDTICVTNINRQIHSLHSTIGKPKVDAMKERLLDINPNIKVETHNIIYNAETAKDLINNDYDYVVDAIDMVSSKIDLIERCFNNNIPIISSMGAGNKLDPTKFEVTDIHKTKMCPLAKVMRKELRKRGVKKLKVVYSKEEPRQLHPSIEKEVGRKVPPGSISFVPSVAGLIIASVLVNEFIDLD